MPSMSIWGPNIKKNKKNKKLKKTSSKLVIHLK